jgi:23S rRNA (pseudouridine1915-N3)-methyltransferase
MNLKIICVGRLKEKYWSAAQAEYLKRMGPIARIEVIEVAAERLDSNVTDEEVMHREGERLLKRIPQGAIVFVLDKFGRQYSSKSFAQNLEKITSDGTTIVFIIGGAAGLHSDVSVHATHKLSLSEMTLPHELARIFLLEQIYRATQILKGGKYHR